jgi:hypothetical protein
VTETRTLQVTVRREELQIQVQDIDQADGVLAGANRRGPATDPPVPRIPTVIVLQEEVPVVKVIRRPYEKVTVEVTLASRSGRVTTRLRHEQAEFLTLETPPSPGTHP